MTYALYPKENIRTPSGSRLNTLLEDTPASVMVAARECLEDFGMNALEEITA